VTFARELEGNKPNLTGMALDGNWNKRLKDNNMPKALHKKLERVAEKKGLKGERKAAYIFGTLHKITKKK